MAKPSSGVGTVSRPVYAGMKRVQFSMAYRDSLLHPLHRRLTAGTPITRAELLMWTPTADPTTLLWCDADRAATEALLDHVESLRSSSLVAGRDGTYAFLRQDAYEFPAPVLDAVAESAVIFLPPVVFLDSGVVRFEAVGEATALSALDDVLSELGTLTVERAHEFDRTHAAAGVTERQRAALEAGLSVGYYEVPRDGSVADVAAVLDCSTSTAGELLRKAEAAVIRGYVDPE